MAAGSHFANDVNFDDEDFGWDTSFDKARNADDDYAYRALDGSYITDDGYIRKRKKHRRRKRRVSPILVFFIVLLLALVAVAGVFGYILLGEAREVKSQAKEVVSLVESVPDAILSGENASLVATANRVAELAEDINATVHGTLWDVATYIPVYGSDIKSAQTLGNTLVNLSDNALVPLANSLEGVSLSGLFANRRVNIEKLTTLTEALAPIIPVIEEASESVEALPDAHIRQVGDYITKVRQPLSEISDILGETEAILPLLPEVFGSEGTRTYFIIAQKQSELRSIAGLPGAVGFVTITDGYIEVGDFGSVRNQREGTLDGYVGETTEERVAFSGEDLYKNMAELTFLPEFERVGQLALEYCAAYWPTTKVDGIVALTPTLVEHLMTATGSVVNVQGQTLDGSNTAYMLNHGTYLLYEDDEVSKKSDEFFSEAADACIDAVFENVGNVSLTDLVGLVNKDAKLQNFLMYMADEEEQQAVRHLRLAGNLDYDEAEPMLGVYLNDYTWSAIDWYLGCETSVGQALTNNDGSVTYQVTTTIRSTLTDEEAANVPSYVTGYNGRKMSRADILTRVYFFAPYGGQITDLEISYEGDYEDAVMEKCTYNGERTVWGHKCYVVDLHTLAQGVNTITYTVTTGTGAQEPLTMRQTPMSNESLGSVVLAWEK